MYGELNTREITIPPDVRESWQKSVDLMAKITGVPAALVMRAHPEDIEVFVASRGPDNPYRESERAPLNTGLYCETVMANRERLLVPNALDDPAWDHNPDIELGMISYMGWPIVWPNGDIFGTICILDRKGNPHDETRSQLLYEFKELIEFSLRSIYDGLLLRGSRADAQRLSTERQAFKKLATTDSLCRIFNRRALFEIGGRLFERLRSGGLQVSVFVIDLDKFKHINDHYGHQTGDSALLHIADLLAAQSRPQDILARFGGDEFVLIIPELASDGASAFAERLLDAVRAQPLRSLHQSVPLSLSIGAFSAPADDIDLHTAIQRADTALLAAKQAGRDRAMQWSTGMR